MMNLEILKVIRLYARNSGINSTNFPLKSIFLCSFSGFCLFLAFLLLHLLFDDACSLLSCNFFKHILDLEHSLVVNWLINFTQQGLISNHSLGELNIRNGCATEMINYILDKDEWLLFHFFICFSFSQEHLNNRFDWRQWERGWSQPFHQIVDRGEDEHKWNLVIGVKSSGRLSLLKALSYIFHEFIVEKVYTNCRLKLI